MAISKNTVVVYTDWINTFEELTDVEAGMLIKHFFRYVNDKEPVAPNRMTELLFIPLKNTLKRDLSSWEQKLAIRSESGIEGNLKRWSPDVYKRYKKGELTLGEALDIAKGRKPSHSDKNIANIADSVTDSVTDTDTDILLKKETKGFLKPTVSIIAEYCYERNNTIDAEDFHNFYESKGWMVGKNKMKDWKAAIRTWEKSRINKENQNGKDEPKIGRQTIATIQANANPNKWFEPEGD